MIKHISNNTNNQSCSRSDHFGIKTTGDRSDFYSSFDRYIMKNGNYPDNCSHETKHRCDTGNNTQYPYVLFQFGNFQFTIVFNSRLYILNRPSYTFKSFLKHSCQGRIVIPAQSYCIIQSSIMNVLFDLKHQVGFCFRCFSYGEVSFYKDHQSQKSQESQWDHYPAAFE